MQKLFLQLLLLFFPSLAFCQTIDVQHYRFHLQLSDETDKIKGEATVQLRLLSPATSFELDLVQRNAFEKGMKADSVKGALVAGFQQAADKLIVRLKSKPDSVFSIVVYYSGIPADGLIIGKNKYGERTFFADNWPNRARHWLPCHDVPHDKATVEFIVTAPAHYQVVSNGLQMEETNLSKATTRTHWKETIPLPTKVMVIGAARFAVARVDSGYHLPVTAWVYPQDREKGFYDYALSTSILQFFSDYIGPYPFQKLANVQSKTIFGGMENASTIFYAESSVTGNRKSEPLLAHEIAHQWFGNMATEKNFAHLWLSEGFATYLTDVYLESKYGREELQERLKEEREQVKNFVRTARKPVVDTGAALHSFDDLMQLLNANSYQKGAWVLHMLRKEVGDAAFQKIIQSYYQQYKGGNAGSPDFQKVAENVSGKKLDTFFQQWLYQPGLPRLRVKWRFDGDKIRLQVQQLQQPLFQFPLEVAFSGADGRQTIHQVRVSGAVSDFSIPAHQKPVQVVLDPSVALLFEGSVVQE